LLDHHRKDDITATINITKKPVLANFFQVRHLKCRNTLIGILREILGRRKLKMDSLNNKSIISAMVFQYVKLNSSPFTQACLSHCSPQESQPQPTLITLPAIEILSFLLES
jgi:hypothetical protein